MAYMIVFVVILAMLSVLAVLLTAVLISWLVGRWKRQESPLPDFVGRGIRLGEERPGANPQEGRDEAWRRSSGDRL
jgi:hypothetical protein